MTDTQQGEPQFLSKTLGPEAQAALERHQEAEHTRIKTRAGSFTVSVQKDFEDNLELVIYVVGLDIPLSQIVVVDDAGMDHRLADEYAE